MILPFIMMASIESALLGLSVAERIKPDPGKDFLQAPGKRAECQMRGKANNRKSGQYRASQLGNDNDANRAALYEPNI
jgi:hypothetical protein